MSDFSAVLLAMAAHDLRQPLQIVSAGYSWLADRHAKERAPSYVAHGGLAIQQMSDQLDRLVDALRVQECSGGLEPAPVDISSVFASLKRDNAEFAARSGVALRVVRDAATVMSEAILLESILRNLIRNAIKYTPSGGYVLVCCRHLGPQVRIEVHDTGVGIPGGARAKIFDAFRRLNSNVDGLGLGLYVVRRAADLLGHVIEVQSEVGRGSCFSVLIDVAARQTLCLPMLPPLAGSSENAQRRARLHNFGPRFGKQSNLPRGIVCKL